MDYMIDHATIVTNIGQKYKRTEEHNGGFQAGPVSHKWKKKTVNTKKEEHPTMHWRTNGLSACLSVCLTWTLIRRSPRSWVDCSHAVYPCFDHARLPHRSDPLFL